MAKAKQSKYKEPTGQKPPDSLGQAFVHILWSMRPLWRNLIFIVVGMSVLVFLLWNTLPQDVKLKVIESLWKNKQLPPKEEQQLPQKEEQQLPPKEEQRYVKAEAISLNFVSRSNGLDIPTDGKERVIDYKLLDLPWEQIVPGSISVKYVWTDESIKGLNKGIWSKPSSESDVLVIEHPGEPPIVRMTWQIDNAKWNNHPPTIKKFQPLLNVSYK